MAADFMEFVSSDHIHAPYASFVHFFILNGGFIGGERALGAHYTVIRERQTTANITNKILSDASGQRSVWKGDVLVVQHSMRLPGLLTDVEREDVIPIINACAATASFGYYE